MIETKVPKDIRNFKTKIIGPFTLRQLITILVALVIDFILYKLFFQNVEDITIPLVIISALTFTIYLTSIDVEGVYIETYVCSVVIPMLLNPSKRKYISVGYKKKKIDKEYLTKAQKKQKEKELLDIYKAHPELEPICRKVRNKK